MKENKTSLKEFKKHFPNEVKKLIQQEIRKSAFGSAIKKKYEHNQKWFQIDNKRIHTDKIAAPLIKELNKAGIRTLASCIGDKRIYSPCDMGYIVLDKKSIGEIEFNNQDTVVIRFKWRY